MFGMQRLTLDTEVSEKQNLEKVTKLHSITFLQNPD